jgi:hypothetical protein
LAACSQTIPAPASLPLAERAASSDGPSPAPTPTPKPPVTVSIRAAVIKNSGEIAAVPRTKFQINPYDIVQVKKSLALRNGMGDSAPTPNVNDAKYQKPLYGVLLTDWEMYYADKDRMQQEWESKAYLGLTDELHRLSGDLSPLDITTDLDGRATAKLRPGNWWVVGYYSFLQGKSNILWNLRVDVTEEGQKVELSNDNGTVINL